MEEELGGEALQLQPMASDKDENNDYDPHLHRNLPKPTNNWETLVHLLKCSLGTGILAMPQAFANAGLVTSVVATLAVGALVTHCLHVLVKAQYLTCRRLRTPIISYRDTAKAALEIGPQSFHRCARGTAIAVDVFLVVYQLGICCVYIVFIADNIKKVCDPYYDLSIKMHMLFILGPLMLFNLIPSLKMLAPFSAVANVLTFLGLGIIVYYLLTDETQKRHAPLDLWGSMATFPLFFGTVLFALTAVGVVIALENNMKTPKAFVRPFGVLNTGMFIIVVIYLALGALGYIYCVDKCADSITLNLPVGPLANAVIIMYAIAIFISYGLHCYVPVEVVWKGYLQPRLVTAGVAGGKLRLAEYLLRVVLCLITFALAASVPRLGLFISLFGALCLSALGICFPALMEMCIALSEAQRAKLKVIKDIFLIIIGMVGLIAGTYTALMAIIRSFEPESTA